MDSPSASTSVKRGRDQRTFAAAGEGGVRAAEAILEDAVET